MTSRSGLLNRWKIWFYFPVFLTANTLLSYFSFSIETRLWILGLGIVLPLVLACGTAPLPKKGGEGFEKDEFLPPPPAAVVGFVGLAALFIRFYKLSSLSGWPLMDEGLTGYFSLEEEGPGSHPFLYSAAQIPPLFFWIQRLFFGWLGPSLTVLWLLPALISLFLVPLSFAAFRAFFSRSFAWLAAAFFALGFWPFYLGRFSMPQVLLVAWELLSLWGLGLFLKTSGTKAGPGRAALLGLLAGGAFYVEFHGVLLAGVLGLAVVLRTIFVFPRRYLEFLCFGAVLAAVSAPFTVAAAKEGAGNYLSMLWAFHPGFSLSSQLGIGWDYLGGLFWGVETTRHAYKPFWGGFLNPLWGSFFDLGCVQLYRYRRGVTAKALGLGFFLFTLPGWMTRELEMFREILVLPVLAAVAVLGLCDWLQAVSPAKRAFWAGAALLAAASLDFYHLLGPYQAANHSNYASLAGYSKSFERWTAWRILEQKERENGPGLILTELDSSPFDQSLTVASYPFNAARNPRLSKLHCRWGAFLTNINYAPFLSRRFPQIQWIEPGLVENESRETVILALVDLEDPGIKSAFQGWADFDKAMHPVTSQMLHLKFGGDHRDILEGLSGLESQAAADPFLRSCLAERVYYNAMAENGFSTAFESLKDALLKGYPAAHLYDDLGVLWFTQGDYAKARQAFQMALGSPLNHTNALENLRRIPVP